MNSLYDTPCEIVLSKIIHLYIIAPYQLHVPMPLFLELDLIIHV